MAPARDPIEAVARVADARRDRLLRVHRRRLRWEDLEDCYSQATLELVARAKRDPFASPQHIQNALEQKFSSRIDDRRRAIRGRSPIETALATALPVDVPEAGAGQLEDPAAEVVRQVVSRIEVTRLREVADELTEDQRLVLACQVSLGMDCAEFCRRFGWSAEKFRKVAQRGRSRLRALVAEYQVGERCARLEPDVIAFAAQAASAEQSRRAAAHLANCTACASHARALDRAARQVAALLPAPVIVGPGVVGKLGGVLVAVRRALGIVAARAQTGVAGVAGGSAAGAGAAVKLGVAAACLAGAAGGYAICAGVPGARRPAGASSAVAHVRAPVEAASTGPAVASSPPRASAAGGGAGLARGRVAVELAEREFAGGSVHTADLLAPSGTRVSTMRSARVATGGSGGAVRSGVPTGTPVTSARATGTASTAPTGTPAGSGQPAAAAATVGGGGQARSEFGGFEH
jgi:DNA-directed RNA polymerase specialized sigma24 family protein